MGLFFGKTSVLADLRLHKKQAGLVTTGTLSRYLNGTYDPVNDVALANVCLWPNPTYSSLGTGGGAYNAGPVCIWRTGESIPDIGGIAAPKGQDKLTIGGTEYLLESVAPRLNADEANGYAIYDCQVTRPA